MIVVDAHRQDLADHAAAAAAVRRLAEGRASWGIAWACVHEFFSVVTNPKIFQVPSPAEVAVEQVEIWMEAPGLKMLCETVGYWDGLKRTVLGGKLKGAQVHEARIHAICVSHGVEELWSADRDFTRMKGVRVVNPCVG